MRAEARFFKSLSDETRLKILWLLSGTEELCVCDIIDVLRITQSKASRHLRYLYHLGWVTDRRDGLWMIYRLAVTPNSPKEKLLKLLEEILAPQPEAQALRGHLERCLEAKRHTECARRLKSIQKTPLQGHPEP
jgi:ArsR family transcriptional regulator, arsenate/arsenite/antimonite-responsive transcriptional repressor